MPPSSRGAVAAIVACAGSWVACGGSGSADGGADAGADGAGADGGGVSTGFPIVIGGASDDEGAAIAAAGSDGFVVAGSFVGAVDFGRGAPDVHSSTGATGNPDVFVSRFGADGAARWTRTFGGRGIDRATALAVAPSGAIFVAGQFYETADLDPGPALAEKASNGLGDGFVVALGPDGSFRWARAIGGAGQDAVTAVRASGAGAIAGGDFEKTVDLQPGSPGGTVTAAGLADLFAAKLDAGGATIWHWTAGGASADHVSAVAETADGAIAVAGCFGGTVTFNRMPGMDVLTADGIDGFITTLSSAGASGWTRGLGGSSDQCARAAVGTASGWLVAGDFDKEVRFPPSSTGHTSNGARDAFAASYRADGGFVAAACWGETASDRVTAMAPGLDGSALVSGYVAEGGGDSFVVRLTPAVEIGARVRFGGPMAADTAAGIAAAEGGGAWVVGQFKGTAELSSAVPPASRTSMVADGYVALITL